MPPGASGERDEPIPAYSQALPVLRAVLASHPGRLNARVHDVPLCLLGEWLSRSTDDEARVVDVYKRAGLEETVRVAGHWGQGSARCAPCAARDACCRLSPAYLAEHGDAELAPFDAAGLIAAREAAERAEERLRQAAASATPPADPAPARPQAALLARLHRAATAGAWAEVRRLAGQVAAEHPERIAVSALKRRAKRELLSAKAAALAAEGRGDEARALAALAARRYADLERAPVSPSDGTDD